MAKTYKDFAKRHIGGSDSASVMMTGGGYGRVYGRTHAGEVPKTREICFGEDGEYWAYIVDDWEAVIGKHYTFVDCFYDWMVIVDDDGLVDTFCADEIEIYRAGEFGCIIRLKR